MLRYKPLQDILNSILIIGLLNLYGISKDIIIKLPTNLNTACLEKGSELLTINEKNILIILLVSILWFILWSFEIKDSIKINLEIELIKGINLIAIILFIISSDLVIFFILLELISIIFYLYVIFKITKNTTRLSIVYLLLGSISSTIILLGILLCYRNTGSINIKDIEIIFNNLIKYSDRSTNLWFNNGIYIGTILIILGLLFKIGVFPFQYWVIRVYSVIDTRILLLNLIIPKLIYIYFIYNFTTMIINSTNINKITLIYIILSIITILISSIGSIYQKEFNKLLAYSSILNIGFLFLALSNNILFTTNNNNLFHYILIYSFNTLTILLAYLLYNKSFSYSKGVYKINILYKNPIYSITILVAIFSFIGLPPLAGFYAKLIIFYNTINNNYISLFTILIIILGTIISSPLYLKFISSIYFNDNNNQANKAINPNNDNILVSENPLLITYLLSFSSLFLLLYPIILTYLDPLFRLI